MVTLFISCIHSTWRGRPRPPTRSPDSARHDDQHAQGLGRARPAPAGEPAVERERSGAPMMIARAASRRIQASSRSGGGPPPRASPRAPARRRGWEVHRGDRVGPAPSWRTPAGRRPGLSPHAVIGGPARDDHVVHAGVAQQPLESVGDRLAGSRGSRIEKGVAVLAVRALRTRACHRHDQRGVERRARVADAVVGQAPPSLAKCGVCSGASPGYRRRSRRWRTRATPRG